MKYSGIEYNDIADGDGFRTSVFVSGCPHHCQGCFQSVTWDFNYGMDWTKDVENTLIQACNKPYIDGLTLLGGDPLVPVNQKVLAPFVKRFKDTLPDKTIWCYTGYEFEQLLVGGPAHIAETDMLLSCLDFIVDGRFVQELKDPELRFKGSANQRIIDVQASLKAGETVLSEYN